MVLMLSNREKRIVHDVDQVLFAVLFIFVLGVLFAECYHTVGSWDFLFSTYGCELGVPDLTPNIGLFW